MKLGVRLVKGGDAFEVDVSLGDSVKDVKAKIVELRPQFLANQQKLICDGRILLDGSKLEDQGVRDGSFLVLMMQSPLAVSIVKPPAPQETFLSQDSVEVLMNIGMNFCKDDVEACLIASHGNADKALDYLIHGIPSIAEATSVGSTPPNVPEAEASAAIAQIRRNALWDSLRYAVQRNPRNLNDVMLKFSSIDPKIKGLINENQEEFVKMLQEPIAATSLGEHDLDFQPSARTAVQKRRRTSAGRASATASGPKLTEVDEEAVKELMINFGFTDKLKVATTYLASDKNKDVTVSSLLDDAN
mmetsp:Transcript_2791/g.4255  ORF Transcript_2791/g.4255 Transcript_2791/m.4255 type:complete len:302 (-) Transcript_2791:77-982(-)